MQIMSIIRGNNNARGLIMTIIQVKMILKIMNVTVSMYSKDEKKDK